jgi:hypothetical protein
VAAVGRHQFHNWPLAHLAVLEPGFTIVVGDLNLLKRERPVLKFQPARSQLFPQCLSQAATTSIPNPLRLGGLA